MGYPNDGRSCEQILTTKPAAERGIPRLAPIALGILHRVEQRGAECGVTVKRPL